MVLEQRLAEGLLLALVDVGEAQHLLGVGGGKLQEGLVAGDEGLVLPCDQQHAVPGDTSHPLASAQPAQKKVGT